MNRKQLYTIALLAMPFIFVGCSKSTDDNTGCGFAGSNIVAPASEIATLQAYVNANHPAAVQHPSGFFYEITAPGSGLNPSLCSRIMVKYSGYLTNGTKFDENLNGAVFILGQLIPGWQKGIPLIKKTGSINLYIPPSLGYGSQGSGSVPGNSILVFVIQLMDVQ